MELLPVAAVGLLLLALIVLVIEWALWRRSRSAAARLIVNAEKEARRLEAQAEIEGNRIQKNVEILARERLLAARTDFERETRDLRLELTSLGNDLDDKKSAIEGQIESLTERETAISALEADIQERDGRLGAREEELGAAIAEQRTRLEQIAGLTEFFQFAYMHRRFEPALNQRFIHFEVELQSVGAFAIAKGLVRAVR